MKRNLHFLKFCAIFSLLPLFFDGLEAKTLFESLTLNPYFGVEYQYQHLGRYRLWRKFIPANSNIVAANLGNKYHQNFGIEIAYYHTLKKAQNCTTFTSVTGVHTPVFGQLRNKGFSFDWNVYYPLDNNMNIIGSLGVATNHMNLQIVSDNSSLGRAFSSIKARNRIIFRPGIGMEVIDNNWGFRGRILAPFMQDLHLNIKDFGTQYVHLVTDGFKQTFIFSCGIFYVF